MRNRRILQLSSSRSGTSHSHRPHGHSHSRESKVCSGSREAGGGGRRINKEITKLEILLYSWPCSFKVPFKHTSAIVPLRQRLLFIPLAIHVHLSCVTNDNGRALWIISFDIVKWATNQRSARRHINIMSFLESKLLLFVLLLFDSSNTSKHC